MPPLLHRPLTETAQICEDPNLQDYERAGGYRAARKAVLEMTPAEVIGVVKDSNLRGRGGAGFPTGVKWSLIPTGDQAPRPKFLAVNADEMEPGTFKDRFLLEGNPHVLIESVIIASYATQTDVAYIFLRWAYKLAAKRVQRAIDEAYAAGYLGQHVFGSPYGFELYLHMSAGRYICGEETGMLNALEGLRGNPRIKPPHPPQSGVWGKPTTVNNVETFCNVPHIINHGAEWFKSLSWTKDGGTKMYGCSGKVRRPGLWELPMGTTIREILEEHAGGARDGLTVRAVLPGGASTEFVLAKDFDVRMDFDSLGSVRSRMGTGTLIALDDQTCPIGMVLNLEHFFAQESCGWCTPCWAGLQWAEQLLQRIENGQGKPDYIGQLEAQTQAIKMGHTFCALAPGAMEPLQSSLWYFHDEYERHIREGGCPYQK